FHHFSDQSSSICRSNVYIHIPMMMIMTKPFLLLVLFLLIGTTNIHGQFQVVHDVPNTEMYPPSIATVVTSDGGMITIQREDTMRLFRKYDGTGQLLWSKVLDDTVSNYMNINTLSANSV